MNKATIAAVLALGCAGLAGPALAAPSLADAWYVKPQGGQGSEMLADRAACITEAEQFGVDLATDFSNPEYGSLTALGAALDDDALHGGAKEAVRRAVRDACMRKKGWTRLDPGKDEVKALKKANSRHPEVLDSWIAANASKVPPPKADLPAPAAAPAPAPAATAPAPTPASTAPATPHA